MEVRDMQSEHVDPVYKYIDDKLAPIIKELDETKLYVATLSIELTAQISLNLLNATDIDNENIKQQLIADESTAFANAKSSSKPLFVANQFKNTCASHLKKLGINVIRF